MKSTISAFSWLSIIVRLCRGMIGLVPKARIVDGMHFRCSAAAIGRTVAKGLITSLIVVVASGCGGGGGGGTSSGGGGTTPIGPGNQVFDSIVGLGADANGVPILEKHANARYVYWNPNHSAASDSNPGTSPSAPKATLRNAWEALRDGYGDWLLMAQGATNRNGFGGALAARSGLSTQYPIVVTTYDPADPANSAAMRRGSVTIGTSAAAEAEGLFLYNFTGQNIVFENIDLVHSDPVGGKFAGLEILNWQTGAHVFNVLFHRVRVFRMQVTIQADIGQLASGIVFRHCAFAYAPNQGMYLWGTDRLTVEDSIFYHNGWSADGSRDTATEAPNIFDHNAYFGTTTVNTLFRRNVSGHSSSHGLQLRGGGTVSDSVFASNPINLIIGGGNDYNTIRPDGVPYDVQNNVLVGSSNIDSSLVRGFGVGFENTQDGGVFKNNLIANIGSLSTGNRRAFVTTWISTQFNLPTYINLQDNIMWNWRNDFTLQQELTMRDYPRQLHFSYSGNIIEFDESPTGTNRNTPATSFPNATRDVAAYASANGYTSEADLWAAMIANPSGAWAKSIGDYIRAGFGR